MDSLGHAPPSPANGGLGQVLWAARSPSNVVGLPIASAWPMFLEEKRNRPRMNTDLHGWESVEQMPKPEGAGELARNGTQISPSDADSIRVHLCSSVAQNLPVSKARTSLTMVVRDEQILRATQFRLRQTGGLGQELRVLDRLDTRRCPGRKCVACVPIQDRTSKLSPREAVNVVRYMIGQDNWRKAADS